MCRSSKKQLSRERETTERASSPAGRRDRLRRQNQTTNTIAARDIRPSDARTGETCEGGLCVRGSFVASYPCARGLLVAARGPHVGPRDTRDRRARRLALLLTTHRNEATILYENTAELTARPIDCFFSGGVS